VFRFTVGDGKFLVNTREVDDYFKENQGPALCAGSAGCRQHCRHVNISVTVSGGGYSGQAGAVVQGLGRAIAMYDVALRPRAEGRRVPDARQPHEGT